LDKWSGVDRSDGEVYPFIHIKSLLFEKSVEIKAVLVGISEEFSHETEIALEHITATWEFFL
jgi:hypothetical protein